MLFKCFINKTNLTHSEFNCVQLLCMPSANLLCIIVTTYITNYGGNQQNKRANKLTHRPCRAFLVNLNHKIFLEA